MTAEGEAGVFASCRFCLSSGSSEDGNLAALIEANGGRVDNYLTDMSTHVIVEDNEGDSDLISEARDLYEKPVVTPRWVRLCIQAKQLLALDGFNPQNRLFHGKVFCISKLEKTDLRSLWAMITFNGGQIQLSMDSKCSHLVTTSIVGDKYSKANALDCIEIVTPDWISDCVSRKELVSCEAYHPSLLITSKEPSPPPPPPAPTPPSAEIKVEPSTTPLPTTPTTPQPPTVLNSRPDSVSSMGPTPPPPQLASPVQQNAVNHQAMQSPQAGPQNSGPNMQGQLAQMLTGGQRMSAPNGPPMSQGQQMVMVSGKTVSGQQVVMQGQRMMFQQQQQPPSQQMPPQQAQLQQQQQQQPPLSPNPQMQQQQQQQQPPPQQQQQHQLSQQNTQGPPQMVRQQWIGPQGQQLSPQQMQMLRQQRHRMVLAPGSNGQRLVVAIPEQLQQMRLRAPMGDPGVQMMGPQGQMVNQAGGQAMMGPQGTQGVQQASGQMSPMAQPLRNQNPGIISQGGQQMMMPPQHQQAQQSQMRPMGPPAPGKPMQRPQQGPPSQQQLQQGGVNPAWRFQQNQMAGQTSPVVSPQGPPPMQWQQQDPMMQQRVQQDPHYQQRVEMQRRQMMQQQQSPGLTSAQPSVAPASSPTSGDSQTPPSLQANTAVQQQQPQQQPSQQPTPPSQSGQAPTPVAPSSQSMTRPAGHMISPIGISSRGPPHTVAQSPQLQVSANAANPAQINPPPSGRVGVLLATTHSPNLPQNAQLINGQMRSMQNISVHQSPLGPQILRSPSPQPQPASGNTVHKMAPQIVQGPMAQNGQRMMVPQQMRMPMQGQQRMPMGLGQVQQIPQQRFVGPIGQPIIQGQPPPGVKVNPQTKTALANLLNNRLGGSQQGEMGIGVPPGPMQQGPMGAPIQGVMRYQAVVADGGIQQQGQQGPQNQALQPQTVAYRPPGPPVRAVRPEFLNSAPQEALVGHEASANVPADAVFIGCTFFFAFSHSQEFTKEQIRVARGVCLEKGGVVVDAYDAQVSHVVCEHQGQQFVEQAVVEGKRVVTLYWINDVVLKGKMVPPWQALHLPTAYGPREMPCQQHVIATTGFSGEERLRIRTMIRKVGAKYSTCMTRENSLLIVKSRRWNENGEKYRKAQEWNMTCVNALWLHDVMLGHYEAVRMPMAHKYQVSDTEVLATRIDFGIAQPLLVAWKAPIRVTDEHWRQFSESEVSKKIQKRKKELAEREANKKKKPTNDENCVTVTNPNPPSEGQRPVVLFSGIIDPEPLKRMILQLGGQIAKSAKDATHLVLPKFCRTIKVMCAVNYVKHICSPEWVYESHKANTFLDPSAYWLQDPDAENQFGFNLRYIYAQRQRCAALPLKGCMFYVTPGCLPTIPVLKDIIESAGGSMYLNKRPTIKYINQVNENPQSKFFCVTCEDDLYMCKELIENQIPLYNVELILSSILRQKVEPEEYLLDCCV